LFGHFPLIFKWKFCFLFGRWWFRLELVDAEESRERDGCPFPAFHFAIGPIDFPCRAP
jgi:hypothetical protein